MSRAAGISTFSSCNKAGSIPHFSSHLQWYPNDYIALNWRARAYSIIGQTENAIKDFQRAAEVSTGPRQIIANAHLKALRGDGAGSKALFIQATQKYPNCAEAWSDLGSIQLNESNISEAKQSLLKSIDLYKSQGMTDEPWYPWDNKFMGDIELPSNIKIAHEYYTEAVRSCNTLTIAHLGLVNCYMLSNDDVRARASFQKARSLNQTLVHWSTYDEYRRDVLKQDIKEAEKPQQSWSSWFSSWFGWRESGVTASSSSMNANHEGQSRAAASSRSTSNGGWNGGPSSGGGRSGGGGRGGNGGNGRGGNGGNGGGDGSNGGGDGKLDFFQTVEWNFFLPHSHSLNQFLKVMFFFMMYLLCRPKRMAPTEERSKLQG